MQRSAKINCHFYHTTGCFKKNCKFIHKGRSNGYCPGSCQHSDKLCVYDPKCNQSNCCYKHSKIEYVPKNRYDENDEYYDEEGYDDPEAYGYDDDNEYYEDENEIKTYDEIVQAKRETVVYEKKKEEKKEENKPKADEPKNSKEDITKLYEDPKKVIEAERKALERVVKLKGDYKTVDLVFLIDCTGSMWSYIKMVKDQTINIIKKTKDMIVDDMYFRVGIVGYRDFDNEASRLEIFPFGTAEKACEFVGKLEAKHGGDGPEDVNGGMQKALGLEWNKPEKKVIRWLIHIADYPCHNKKFHDFEEDDFPEGHKDDRDFKELFGDMNTKKINYLFLKITKHTNKMIEEFRKLYEDPALKKIGNTFRSQEINSYDGELFSNIISSSIQDSFASSSSRTIFDNDITISTENSDLYEQYMQTQKKNKKLEKIQDMKLENNHSLNLLDTLNPISDSWEISSFNSLFLFSDNLEAIYENEFNTIPKQLTIKVQSKPFAKGSFSYAYRCEVSVPKNLKSNVEFDMVLKKPIETQKDSYFTQGLKKNLLAIMLANSFNDHLELAGISPEKRIYFSRIIYIKNDKDSYFIEGFIDGTFTKYTNNSTFVNEAFPLMTAFSHFSYTTTQGKFMVTDLQGRNNLLTDPAIHSRFMEFREHGDRSFDGMMAFFSNHKCNEYCQKLQLQSHFAQQEVKTVLKMGANITTFREKCANPFCNNSILPNNVICLTCINKKVDLKKMMGI